MLQSNYQHTESGMSVPFEGDITYPDDVILLDCVHFLKTSYCHIIDTHVYPKNIILWDCDVGV